MAVYSVSLFTSSRIFLRDVRIYFINYYPTIITGLSLIKIKNIIFLFKVLILY